VKILILVLTIGLVIGAIAFFWYISPAKSKLIITRGGTHFPIVSGYNLNRQEFEFPRDFGGDLNLVIIAFQQYQQTIVNTWIPFAQQVEEQFPGVLYYELPTIYKMPSFSRTFINEGMRAGIPDQTARERTITLYIDKQAFKSALDIPGEGDICILLVDRDGNILARTSGEFTKDKADELTNIIQESYQET
jgi:hypothetical protein